MKPLFEYVMGELLGQPSDLYLVKKVSALWN
jgi:hypothetical protein